jgi:hypothetical protein
MYMSGEKSRKRVNLSASEKALSVGESVIHQGRVINHTYIDYTTPDIYRDDGVHMSDIGNDILLNDLQSGIETFITTEGKVFPPGQSGGREVW